MEVYFCHQNQNANNIGDLMTLLKPHSIGTHLKGLETSFIFEIIPLFSSPLVSYGNDVSSIVVR
jgi:hypothetical protein